MNIISFSLWGDSAVYNQGAIQNVAEAAIVYPGWRCRFYVDPRATALPRLRQLDCDVIEMPRRRHRLPGYFWRFSAIDDPAAEWVLFRDCDSRVNHREKAAVAAWQQSGKGAHVMRDAPAHGAIRICAGMWGLRKGVVPNLRTRALQWVGGHPHHRGEKVADELFLAAVVWPIIAANVLQHGHGGVPFPPHEPMRHGEYVGQVIHP